jgi:phospholipid/cholesterol/gamma-HCH transport system ATP-binding protein
VYSELEPDEKRTPHRNRNGFQGSAYLIRWLSRKIAFPLKMFTNDNKAYLKNVDFVLERVALTDAHNKLPSFLEECKNVCYCSRYCQQA